MYQGKAKRRWFWTSGHFAGYLVIMVIYGTVSFILFWTIMWTGAMLDSMSLLPGLVDLIKNLIGPFSLINLMFMLPAVAVILLVWQYFAWRVSLSAILKAEAKKALEKEAEGLLRDLREPDSRARTTAARALRTIDLPVVAEALNGVLLTDPSPEVRAEAYRSLRFMGRTPLGLVLGRLKAAQDKSERLTLIRLLGAGGDSDQIGPVIKLYAAESDRDVKKAMLEALGRFANESVKDLYISVLRNDTDRDLRLTALQMLRWYGDDETVDFLKRLLADPDDAVRVEAAKLFKLQGASPENVTVEPEKRPCAYCGQPIEITNDKCPGCGAPISP